MLTVRCCGKNGEVPSRIVRRPYLELSGSAQCHRMSTEALAAGDTSRENRDERVRSERTAAGEAPVLSET